MDESLTERRRVRDEGLRIVNRCDEGRTRRIGNDLTLTVPR